MNTLERQGLLLRQIAALRRQGMAHHQALALAADGLPVGELRALAQRAGRNLTKGGEGTASTPLEALLGRSDASVEELVHGAAALEARLWAQCSLRTARLYYGVALAGPPLLACLLAWVTAPLLAGEGVDGGMVAAMGAVLRWSGVPLAVAALFLVRSLHHSVAPGYRQAVQAAALLELASRGGDLPVGLLDPNAGAFFAARRASAGSETAARELAAELCAESQRVQAIFGQLAPVLGAIALVPIVVVGLGAVAYPVWAITQSLGRY